MSVSLYDCLLNSGGKVDFVFHVSGMPWTATTSSSLSSYLRSTGTGTAYCFGERNYSSMELYMPHMACLNVGETNWSWRYDDAEGLSGGDWSVSLAEVHSGQDWSSLFAGGGDSIGGIVTSPLFGVPGVTQIFDAQNDTAIRLAELASDVSKSATTITIRDIRGMATYLDAIPAAGALLWIGHECVLVDGVTDNLDGTYDVSVALRGVLRTRKQPHVVNEYAARSEYVSTAPLGGIVGRPAQLWAFCSDDGGTTYGKPTLVHHGKVSQGISIRGGIAEITVNGPWSWFDGPSAAADFDGTLRGIILQRGNIGSSENATYGGYDFSPDGFPRTWVRAPHLMFYEVATDGAGGTRDHYANVWLCEKNSYRYFETFEELCAAIQVELDALYYESDDQMSGDDTTGNPKQTLYHKYRVTTQGICREDNSESSNWFFEISGDLLVAAAVSMVSGPLALAFNLSHTSSLRPAVFGIAGYFEPSSRPQIAIPVIQQKLANQSSQYNSLGDLAQYVGAGYHFTTWQRQEEYWQYVPPADYLPTAFILDRQMPSLIGDALGIITPLESGPLYYYEHGNDTDADPCESYNAVSLARNHWAVPTGVGGNENIFVRREDGYLPAVDSAIYLGPRSGNPALRGTVGGIAESGDYYVITIDSEPTYAGNTINAFCFIGPTGGHTFSIEGTHHILSWWPLETNGKTVFEDPWAVSQGSAAEQDDDPVELLKGALNISELIALGPAQTLYWIPELGGDTCDGESWIDWDDLSDKLQPVFADEKYIWRCTEEGFKKVLYGLLRSHGITPYLELDDNGDYYQWVMRFRQIGVVNVPDAYVYGRRLDDDMFADNNRLQRDVATGHVYSSINFQSNFNGDGFDTAIKIADKSAYAQGGYSSKEYAIADYVTSSDTLLNSSTDAQAQATIAKLFTSAILPHISRARPLISTNCVARAWLLPVGGDVLVTDDYARHPFTGAIGFTELPGIVSSISVSLGSLEARVSYRLARSTSKGWAPALYCPASTLTSLGTELGKNKYSVALTGSPKAPTHEFSGSGEPQDASRFDCWDFNRVTGTYSARPCDCDKYAISIHKTDDASASYIDGTCQVTGFDTGSIAMYLWLDSTITTTDAHVIEFGSYDDLQPCQTAMYVSLCDDDGLLGTADDAGDEWV